MHENKRRFISGSVLSRVDFCLSPVFPLLAISNKALGNFLPNPHLRDNIIKINKIVNSTHNGRKTNDNMTHNNCMMRNEERLSISVRGK